MILSVWSVIIQMHFLNSDMVFADTGLLKLCLGPLDSWDSFGPKILCHDCYKNSSNTFISVLLYLASYGIHCKKFFVVFT